MHIHIDVWINFEVDLDVVVGGEIDDSGSYLVTTGQDHLLLVPVNHHHVLSAYRRAVRRLRRPEIREVVQRQVDSLPGFDPDPPRTTETTPAPLGWRQESRLAGRWRHRFDISGRALVRIQRRGG